MRSIMSGLSLLRRVGQKTGPYLLLELLMPGGTLLALALFLCQRRKPELWQGAQRVIAVVTGAVASVFTQRGWVLAPIRVAIPVSKAGRAERR